MNIIIEGYGTFLAKKGKRIIIKQKNQQKEFAIYKIDSMIIDCRGISLSSNLIKELQNEKINILFIDRDKPIAFINYLHKNPLLTKEQLHLTESQKSTIAKEIILKKINGQLSVLKSLKKTSLITDLSEEEKIHQKTTTAISLLDKHQFQKNKNTIFALEAEFAQKYWAKLSQTIPQDYGFSKREKRGARDSLNASLNYGYAILASKVLTSVLKAGLDPTIGILHATQENRNSLVFDLMEPYRPLIDRAIITLFTKKIFSIENDFSFKEFLLTKTGKEKVIEKSTDALSRLAEISGKQMQSEKAILFTCYNLRNFIQNKNNYFYTVVPK